MDETDRSLARATAIFLDELSDETDAELETLLPPLVAAGYVAISGESPTGHFWSFTEESVLRQESLGLLAED